MLLLLWACSCEHTLNYYYTWAVLHAQSLLTYKLLLMLRLSGAYLIIQIGLYLQVNTLVVIYKSRYNSIDLSKIKL